MRRQWPRQVVRLGRRRAVLWMRERKRSTLRISSFVPAGPHRFVTGLIQSVHCDSPALDLTITSQAKRVALHADNYYRVQFTALFGLGHDLQPCQDLENRTAKVEYVESANGQDTPRLIAVELHK